MDTDKKIICVEDILKHDEESMQDGNETDSSSNMDEQEIKCEKPIIPKGKPKSGRIWKEQKTRFSSIVKTRGIRLSLAKKQKLKDDLKRVKEKSRALKAEKQEEKKVQKQRRMENLKRSEENRKKNEIVQVITNTAKIKRMKKKQLRMIEKRDTTNIERNVKTS